MRKIVLYKPVQRACPPGLLGRLLINKFITFFGNNLVGGQPATPRREIYFQEIRIAHFFKKFINLRRCLSTQPQILRPLGVCQKWAIVNIQQNFFCPALRQATLGGRNLLRRGFLS